MYFCYLLTSKRTPTSKATYIGFSTQPIHRLRQHNGELVAGARKTSKYRPWVHVAIVSGFPNKITALQFEWQWQHPDRTRIAGNAVLSKRNGYKKCLDELVNLLNKKIWKQLDLSVLFPNEDYMKDFQLIAGSEITIACTFIAETYSFAGPSKIPVGDALPSEVCHMCTAPFTNEMAFWTCTNCDKSLHIVCTANKSLVSEDGVVPARGECTHCNFSYPWCEIVRKIRNTNAEQENEDVNNTCLNNDEAISCSTDSTIATRKAFRTDPDKEIVELCDSDEEDESSNSESEVDSYCWVNLGED